MSFESTSKNWEGLAQRDALWAICTTQGKEGGNWDEETFFETGAKEINTVFDYFKKNKIQPVDQEEALDFGCGVGRLTRALSNRFAYVTGIDVSETMVEKAHILNQNKANNLTFLHNPHDDLSMFSDGRFSFVYTTIVLQHIPFPESLGYIKEMIRILKPGGLLVFQVPTQDIRKLSPWVWLKTKIKIRERLAMIGIGKGFQMEMNPIPESEVLATVKEAGGNVLATENTNHTDPNFDGSVRFLKDEERVDFISRMFVVQKG